MAGYSGTQTTSSSRPYNAAAQDHCLGYLAKDKKITPNDIKIKIEALQPNIKSMHGGKMAKLLFSSTEDVNREGLANLASSLAKNDWNWNTSVGDGDIATEALSFFQPAGGPITKTELKRLAAFFSPYGVPWKEDVSTLLKLFDKDGDGVIGIDDFKSMLSQRK
ncbi:hypothetical protein SmJEL517_g04508 [Synchytrium microbalum]|uniref:EF-hand domain-containing protein n=1 Tax=Synchytrium microbalum TaxID=1806994 RepID=A0A507BYX8_9FUNG|nr:uncharacterized protein SmJEL517_g04508 [Synchytrium microbalum]TPX32321.1 hypothetical protein SmJEL517_g04508 [Synchytrium microbalum]